MEVPRRSRRGGGTTRRSGTTVPFSVDECGSSTISRQSDASDENRSARSPASFIFEDSIASEASSQYYHRRRARGEAAAETTTTDSNSEASSSVHRILTKYTSTTGSTHPIIKALVAEATSSTESTTDNSDTNNTNTNNTNTSRSSNIHPRPSHQDTLHTGTASTPHRHNLVSSVAPPPTKKIVTNPFMSYFNPKKDRHHQHHHKNNNNNPIRPSHSFPNPSPTFHNNFLTGTPPQQKSKGGTSMPRSSSNPPISSPEPKTVDVSDLTSASMISPYTTSSCSEAESLAPAYSPSSSSSAASASGGGRSSFKSSLLMKTPTSHDSSRNKKRNSNSSLHRYPDPSEEDDEVDDTKNLAPPSNSNSTRVRVSAGWRNLNLSPACTTTSSNPQEEGQQQRNRPQQRPPRPQGGGASAAGGSTRSDKISKIVMGSPSSWSSPPDPSSFSTISTISTHVSNQNNSTASMMDNSSLGAQESSAASISGILSESTGFHSEVTEIVRNSNGLTRVVMGNNNKRGDIESGGSGGSSVSAIPIQGPIRPPISMVPSIIMETDEDQQQQLPPQAQQQQQQLQQQPEQQQVPEKYKPTKRAQGWIIGSLVALFVFGLITMIVSFVLSKNDDNSNNGPTVMLDDPTATVGGGAAAIPNDDIYNPFLQDEEDDDTLEDLTSLNGTLVDSIPSLSSVPTTTPSLDEEEAQFADAVEELLDASQTRPLLLPPSIEPTTTMSETTQFPSPVPTSPRAIGEAIISSEQITHADPNTPKPTPTTTLPPTPAPTILTDHVLLHQDAKFQQEAKLLGGSLGDAAGSSVSLSSNGQILLVGSPNAKSPTTGFERAGEVNVYKRRQVDDAEAEAGVGGKVQQQWILRATIRSEQEEELDQLGFSVATNRDGSIVVVSEPTADGRRGRVTIYVWENDREIYIAEQILRGGLDTTDHFGISIGLSDSGRRLAVGSPYHSTTTVSDNNLRGKVQVFEYSTVDQTWNIMKAWREEGLVGASDLDWFGWSVSLSKDGEVLSVGAPRNTEFGGYVQCFRYDNLSSQWGYLGSPILNLIPPIKLDDRFGHSTSIANTGSRPSSIDESGSDGRQVIRVAVGAPWKDVGTTLNSGMVSVYEWNEASWTWSLENDSNNNEGAFGSILVEDEPGFYHQLGYSIAMEGDLISVGIPGWDNRRGMVNLYWLPHAFGGGDPSNTVQDAAATNNSPWKHLTNPITGDAEGDDFGFSVSSAVLQPRSPDAAVAGGGGGGGGREDVQMITIAAGAIMVSATTADDDDEATANSLSSTGYTMIFQRRGLSSYH